MASSPSSSASKRATPSSPQSRHGSPTSRSSVPGTPSFFIIQEPDRSVVIRPSPSSPIAAEKAVVPSSSQNDLDRQRGALASRQSLSPGHSLNSGSPGPRRRHDRTASATNDSVLREETEEDLSVDDDGREAAVDSPVKTTAAKPKVLSILNRCGSSPDLPLHNSWSTVVFSSSKKRQLLKPSNGTGASPHLATLQRSRLVPLPINIRTGTLKRDTSIEDMEPALKHYSLRADAVPDPHSNDVEEERINFQITIASLKQRLTQTEKELAKKTKQCSALDKVLETTTNKYHALQNECTQLTTQLSAMETGHNHLRHAFDKLSDKYASVYDGLAKVSDSAATTTDKHNSATPLQLVIQTLTRENQELHRKLRVLEARHADHKAIVGNQEKQIKRLRAEMEALQHMAGKVNKDVDGGPSSDLPSATYRTSDATVANAVASTGQCDEAAYIDPNILKVLEKVDSQFSITNAITLASVLKKWLHSCLHVVASTDLHGVLHVLMKRVCELLHCQHAAIFHVDHGAKTLIGLASERGIVRWELPLDKGILGHAARQNAVCNVRKAYDDPRFFSSSDTITSTKSREVLCIPLTRELENSAHRHTVSASGSNPSVFAVLQCWNTTTQKPFTPNDHIVGGLLAIQAGVVLSQTRVSDRMQYVHTRVLHLATMNEELAAKASVATESSSAVSIVHLVKAGQRKLAETIGITKLRIFIFDADVMRIWHAGAQLTTSATDTQLTPVRKYANVHSSLCALLLDDSSEGESEASRGGCRIVLDPTSEPMFNDTVDLKGGANGLYLAPIRSPWRPLPLAMIQVTRSGSAMQLPQQSEDGLISVFKKERANAQEAEDAVVMDLITLFSQQFSSVLHHAMAMQLHEECPVEVQQARLSYLTDRLENLESEYLREQEEAEAEAELMAKHAMANARFEEKVMHSVLSRSSTAPSQTTRSRPSSAISTTRREERVVLEPVPLISTDSQYAIDMTDLGSDASPSSDGAGSSEV